MPGVDSERASICQTDSKNAPFVFLFAITPYRLNDLIFLKTKKAEQAKLTEYKFLIEVNNHISLNHRVICVPCK